MIPVFRAATALQRYAPMFVVDVWTLRVPSSARLSATSPLPSYVIAAIEAHVSAAYRRMTRVSPSPPAAPASRAAPADPGAPVMTSPVTAAATRTRLWRMAASDLSQTLRLAVGALSTAATGTPPSCARRR